MLLNVTVFARFQPEGRHWPPQDLDRRAGSVGAREVPLARVRGRRSAARPWTRFGQWRSAGPARAAGPRRRSRSARRAGGLRRVWPCTVATDAAVDSRRAMTRSAGAAPPARVPWDDGGEAGAQGALNGRGGTVRLGGNRRRDPGRNHREAAPPHAHAVGLRRRERAPRQRSLPCRIRCKAVCVWHVGRQKIRGAIVNAIRPLEQRPLPLAGCATAQTSLEKRRRASSSGRTPLPRRAAVADCYSFMGRSLRAHRA
jgi:hypothetical protein